MGGVDSDLQRLQPVAVDHALEREGVRAGGGEAIEIRKCRRCTWAHIRKQDPALLRHGIGLLPDIGTHPAAFGLGRRIQAFAFDVEQPAMKGAAQPPMLQASEGQIRTAVRAGTLEQPMASIVVAEQHQIFAEQPNRLDRPVAGQFIDECGGLPIAAHQLAGRSAGPGAGDEIILIGAEHAEFLLVW